ncbi:GNAT family N-acetyltransferase [Natronoflexus pectinivorans]|uniref:Acetyltransferase (GNAT) family protein n=1 Tax=Natronoflexus pectinivorans TaxID=682526 RepID=A0A4R2GFW5_9BACT|nr:GNAT family N-acetyltransferase [Natronoflexus pectinivorans]TCO06841.1 acetyltransferase (GNAT) family protein [Natronoflexus pectinivorans]
MEYNREQLPNQIIVQFVDDTQWSSDLNSFRYSLFLSPEWVNSVCNKSVRPVFLNFLMDDTIVAKLSGILINGGKIKGVQLYCYASPALKSDDEKLYNSVHLALLEFAKHERIARIVLGSYDQQHTMECNTAGFFKTRRFEYVVNLNNGENLHFSKGFKKNVKKALNAGVKISSSNSLEVLEKLFELLENTRQVRIQKYGNDYNPFYLQLMNKGSITRLVQSKAGMLHYVVDENEEIHCVVLNIEQDGRVYGLLMGSDDFAYQNGLSSLVDHSFIEKFKNEGFKYYNPGGGTGDDGNAGIEKYKSSMGAEKIELSGSTTNFLIYPQKFLNPLLNLGRKLPASDKGVIGFLKRFI